MAKPKDRSPNGQPPEPDIGRLVLQDMRHRTNAMFRDDREKKPLVSMSRIYQQTRQIARMAGPAAMERLVYLSENSPDDRVSMVASLAILDRAGVTPQPYNPAEAERELMALPLEERREKLRLLMLRAAQLLRGPGPLEED